MPTLRISPQLEKRSNRHDSVNGRARLARRPRIHTTIPHPLPMLLAVVMLMAFTALFVLALPASASAASSARTTPAQLSAFQINSYDAYYPDWCDDFNDDPEDDCQDSDQDPPIDQVPPAGPPPGQPAPAPAPDDGAGDDWTDQPQLPIWPPTPNGEVARIAADGRTAIAPKRAPRLVKDMIHAANRITRKPYKWGGGHARLTDTGYDCSGSTSYVLRSVGLVNGSMVSGGYKSWGVKGAGRWVNVYANNGHVFMVIAGLRFDTSGAGESGPRWRGEERWSRGFKLRHPARY
ncbi:MAG: hypothetical protein HY827_07990 [Actinobacteria bacterium]|nr:hypothetical protein [Actinomycetota bacterium]